MAELVRRDVDGNEVLVVMFDRSDEVLGGLLDVTRRHGVTGASLTAVGALERATVGYFDRMRRDFHRITVDEQVEVLSLVGDIATRAVNLRNRSCTPTWSSAAGTDRRSAGISATALCDQHSRSSAVTAVSLDRRPAHRLLAPSRDRLLIAKPSVRIAPVTGVRGKLLTLGYARLSALHGRTCQG
ncbi:MAG TPA: PPC domain-containing DNA-binding protein [Jiangellaceae bacterium]|nr:PPC domain-containing DNA-binding protein [Jiangellaceae bacterium]